MFKILVCIFCVSCIFQNVHCNYDPSKNNENHQDREGVSEEPLPNEIDSENEPFVPTHEWQKVKPGQAVPAGLHIKMDMTTGGKWAKLMDNENPSKSSAVVPVDSNDELDTTLHKSHEDLKYDIKEIQEALKKLQSEKTDEMDSKNKGMKSKFRTIGEIRETFKQLELKEESDFQVMKRLVSTTLNTSTSTVTEKQLALQDLEYYVHQIDNANDLVNFGGFAVVVNAFNNSDIIIREEAAHVLGSAMQSNPKVQIEALKLGVLQTALATLQNQQEPAALRKKCMFALSSLVRHFPLAQSKLAQYGGFQVMLNFFREEDNEQLQIKAIRLVTDLTEERLTAKNSEDDHYQERLKQYGGLQLIEFVKELGWCQAIASSLKMQQHGRRESVFVAMRTLQPFCQHEFNKDDIINSLKKLQIEYITLMKEDTSDGEADDSYFSSLYKMTKRLLQTTRVKDEF